MLSDFENMVSWRYTRIDDTKQKNDQNTLDWRHYFDSLTGAIYLQLYPRETH